jgi:ELWxxDGT repeat protein
MIFVADSNDTQNIYNELWKTDGTPEGTVLVKSGFGAGGDITHVTTYDGKLYFAVWGQLWTSDGTAQGTTRVATINPSTSASIQQFTVANGLLFFRATDPTNGAELWRTDGTEAGTHMVRDVRPGPTGSIPTALVSIGEALLFMADDGEHGRELWRSDGSEAGTVLVKDAIPGANGTSYGNVDQVPVARLDGLGIFIIRDPVAGDTVWRSDGTEGGTFRVPNLTPDAEPRTIQTPVQVGDQLFFTNIRDLWRTDGQTMVALSDASPLSSTSPYPGSLAELNGALFFDSRSDRAVGAELYRIAAPTADAGVSYTAAPGGVVELDGTASSDPDPGEVLSYAWDLDGDGVFGELGAGADRGDELGPTVEFSADGLGEGTYPVQLRVTNSAGLWHQASADMVVQATQVGVQTVVGDETEADQWTVRYSLGNVQVYRRFGSSLVLEEEWPSSEVRELRFLGIGGDDRVSVFSTLPLTKVVLDGGDGTDTLLFTADNDEGVGGGFERLEVYGGASLLVGESLATDVVELGEGSRLTLAAGGGVELRTKQLLMDVLFGDTLDLNDNALIVEEGDAGALEALVAASRNASGGAWTGAGITSTLAKTQALRGVGVTTLGSGVLVSYTYDGDANGDGRVNADDYFRIDSGFLDQPANPLYGNGDFNFDDTINADDYFLIDSAFLGQGQPAAAREVAVTAADVASAQVESPAVRKKGKVVKRGGEEPFQARRRVAAVARRGR